MKTMTPTVPRLEAAVKTDATTDLLPPIMSGHEAAVEEIVRTKNVIDAKQAQLAEARAGVERVAGEMRTAKEADGGLFSKTILVRGEDHNLAFVYTDSFCAVHTAAEQQLRALLGEHFDALFQRRREVTVADHEALADALRGGNLISAMGFLEVAEYLAPVAEFRRRRFELRKQLSAAQNVGLDAVIAQIASKPQMSVA